MQFEMPWLSHLDVKQVDQELIKKVPIHFARRYRVLPLRVDDGAIVVATTDPLETAALGRSSASLGDAGQAGADQRRVPAGLSESRRTTKRRVLPARSK